jgi:1-aminocyclopropane-1-carboxylate deaminase/D-cysteine desulfhydrase-like pyridoxal-dependent ACC family enzyme
MYDSIIFTLREGFMSHPICSRFPALADKIPYTSLGDYPTPVEKLSGLGKKLGTQNLFIKRDDKSSKIYGGNKVRKLEFLLADALAQKKTHTLTFGYAGSNHTLATAVYATRLNMHPISIHLPQSNARYVQKNLLYQKRLGAELHHYSGMATIYVGTVFTILKTLLKTGKLPSIIPPGGSNALGVIGASGGIIELAAQIKRRELPEPDYIYVPVGSAGTAAGLALGLTVTDLKSKLMGVAVTPPHFSDFEHVKKLFDDAVKKLRKSDPTLPPITLSRDDIEIITDYIGNGYARFTKKGMDAVALIKETDGIALEGTYTGKTLSALIDHARTGRLDKKTVLFWNTFNSTSIDNTIKDVDYHTLPRAYHRYFEKDFQPLEL